MYTYHIHISGLVQGVGFRPFVYKLAQQSGIPGCINNGNDGVHIEFNADKEKAALFYNAIISSPPENAIITRHSFEKIETKIFLRFDITKSDHQNKPSLLLTTDLAVCPACKKELADKKNKRFDYPFITCLNCGPRYSIISSLPYDRENTTMAHLAMCNSCSEEFNNEHDRRHYSQTNSCKDCAINLQLYDNKNNYLSADTKFILQQINEFLKKGKILAVKGVGGYLLMCDATNEEAINTLRKRKHRNSKPFALLYPDVEILKADVHLSEKEINALQDKTAPIVLCRLKENITSGICVSAIAPGLDKIGAMLPYTGLFVMIAESFGKPMIATSGNISGSPILFSDDDALNNLFDIADYIIAYDRDIVVPQDDSVIQFSASGQKIILRRSRGLAPNYHPNPFTEKEVSILGMGAELKSSFALTAQSNLYVSQFLGDQGGLESQNAYSFTLQHIINLLQIVPEKILIDQHPDYFVSNYGKDISKIYDGPVMEVQHHKAHFAAVLAENNLLKTEEPVLGIIWDGTGYGDDKQIWGGEIFTYNNATINRIAHLEYFPQLLGDKMSKEPRLSALSLLHQLPDKTDILKNNFSEKEWQYYQQLIQQPASLHTCSMGRFLDGIASLLNIQQLNDYEGEAAMKLETLARSCKTNTAEYYPFVTDGEKIRYDLFLQELLKDVENKIATSFIAQKVFNSLAQLILQISDLYKINKIAFSGGVFQNAFLIDRILDTLPHNKELYFHKQLSPNDECIGFGQIAYHQITTKN